MSKEELNNAFNKMSPTELQKEKMLSCVLKASNVPAVKKSNTVYKFVYKFSAVAAAFVVAAGLYKMYPFINSMHGNDEQLNKPSTSVASTNDREDAEIVQKDADAPKDNTHQSVAQNNASTEKKQLDDFKPKITTDEASKNNITAGAAPEVRTSEGAVEKSTPQTNADAKITDDNAVSDTIESTPKVSSAVESKTKTAAAADIHINSNYVSNDAVILESAALTYGRGASNMWTIDEYKAYLGIDIESIVKVPSDMKNKTATQKSVTYDEENEPSDDSWTFVYESSTERNITVTTTKQLEKAQSILNNKQYEKSTLNGVAVDIFYDDTAYTAYLIKNNISYLIEAVGTTQTELETLLNSVTDY